MKSYGMVVLNLYFGIVKWRPFFNIFLNSWLDDDYGSTWKVKGELELVALVVFQ